MTETATAVKPVAQASGKKGSSPWHSFAAAWFGEAFDAMDASIYFIALYPAMSELLHSKSVRPVLPVVAADHAKMFCFRH